MLVTGNTINECHILNMCALNTTFPHIPSETISRETYLDLIDQQFAENKVLCVSGQKGAGVSMTLAMFAMRHSMECVSYFNYGLSRMELSPKTIEDCLTKQLMLYIDGDVSKYEEINLRSIMYKALRRAKSQHRYIYFVIDGFATVPADSKEILRDILAPWFSNENIRFLFSGISSEISAILPRGMKSVQSNSILTFQQVEVSDLLRRINKDISNDEIDICYKLTGGNATQLSILLEKYGEKGSFDFAQRMYQYNKYDFYKEDWDIIEESDDSKVKTFLGFLIFSELPLNQEVLMSVLEVDVEQFNQIAIYCSKYIREDKGCYYINSISLRKYLCDKLTPIKNDIELLLIDVFERTDNIEESFLYLPSLYRKSNRKSDLVSYLTSDKVQHFLEEKKSQAALNEQCEFGFNASTGMEDQAGECFRFALNRSSSREIEKNELSDSEIEALIAVGEDEKAFALAQKVFLLEERLKCLLIIARAGKHLSDTMMGQLREQINVLSASIDFEHIPDKAIELAKLMLPIDFVEAMAIIDKVANQKNRIQLDSLYAAISLSYEYEGEKGADDMSKADIVSTKIEDDGIRKMANAMKSIMTECTADEILQELEKLPTSSSKLYFLQFWIPDHKDIQDIGKVVKYAVKLTLESSNVNVPKVSLIGHFCKPLVSMSREDILEVVSMIDSVTTAIQYPTIDYVDLQLTLIQSLSNVDSESAKNKLENIYLQSCDHEDKTLNIQCKSLILSRYDELGNKCHLEKWLMPAFELQKEIISDILCQFGQTAYHMKVVETPIKELVCKYPSLVEDVIPKMNTEARRSKAYLLALNEYIKQTDIESLNWDYLTKLFNKVTFDKTDLDTPIIRLVRKVVRCKDNKDALLDKIKQHLYKINCIEHEGNKCYVLSILYVWVKNNFSDLEFEGRIKEDLDKTWDTIGIPLMKVEVGYQIAKQLSKISLKEDAHDYIRKTEDVRKLQLLSSFSCMSAYQESLSLFVHSIGILVRSNLCKDSDLEQLVQLLAYDDSEGDAMIAWSRIALEFYLNKNENKFSEIVNEHVSKSLDKYSLFYQKYILYHISPALFLSGQALFFNRLKNYDAWFVDLCLENVARFVRTKYPYPDCVDTRNEISCNPLDYKDFEYLILLMEHSNDECFIYNTTQSIAEDIKDNNSRLSREQRDFTFSSLENVINTKLPMVGGIQHDGYKIACLAMIDGCKKPNDTNWSTYKSKIEAIPNVADKAFLYAQVAHYIKKADTRIEFLSKAVETAESIACSFDKMSRFDMCIEESFSTTSSMSRNIVNKAMESTLANKNGKYEDVQKLIDQVREHDEQLADSMLDMVDRDPARLSYKNKLKSNRASKARLKSAKEDISNVTALTNQEQISFFEKQLEVLIKGRNVARDVDKTISIMLKIYENPISDTNNAILYFMENLYRKHSVNNRHSVLIRKIHEAIVCNLKIVLAIASGTYEKLERINRIMDSDIHRDDNFVRAGEHEKGFEILLKWYMEHSYNQLRIVDAYFHIEDFLIIKKFFDINNDLNVNILTHKQKYPDIDVFQKGWNRVSADMTGSISITTVCFNDDPGTCPIHDRWWVLYDNETGESVGLRLESLSGLGKRDSEISEMDEQSLHSFNSLWIEYIMNGIRKKNERRLDYDYKTIK